MATESENHFQIKKNFAALAAGSFERGGQQKGYV
jgi:hypothetical protein